MNENTTVFVQCVRNVLSNLRSRGRERDGEMSKKLDSSSNKGLSHVSLRKSGATKEETNVLER